MRGEENGFESKRRRRSSLEDSLSQLGIGRMGHNIFVGIDVGRGAQGTNRGRPGGYD
jgi:hypothetical protein